jgi:tetratricopeptide (TPR) repeat protein
MVESLAQRSFEQGRYTDALTLYLTNAGRESDRAGFYYTRAAIAAWHACDYQMATEILEGRINENAEDPFMRFALGTAYQSLGDLDRAEEQYRMVTRFAQGTNVERAWFHLATVQAAQFGRSREEAHAKNALDSLNKSMDSARTISAAQRKKRVEMIEKALIPLADRPAHACSEGYHATQNLRPLSEVPAMQRWVKQPKSFDISGSQLTVR